MTPGYQRVLLVRIDKVGDMLLTMPAVRAVRDALPRAHLTLLAAPYNSVVVNGWDAVDEVQTYDPAWSRSARISVVRQLRRARFDACLVFSPGLEGYILARLTGARTRVGLVYSRRVLDRLLCPALLTASCIVRVDEAVRAGQAVPHLVDQAMAVVVRAGLPAGKGELEVVKTDEGARWAAACLTRTWPGARRIVALHLSPKWFESGWSPANLVVLVERLVLAVPGCAVLLTCGVHDRSAMEALVREPGAPDSVAAGGPPGGCDLSCDACTMCAGRAAIVGVDYLRWVGLFSRCDVIVTRDTAAIHLASALGRPVVAVYAVDGFARNSQQFAPWRVPHGIVRDGPFERVVTEVVEAVAALANRERIPGAHSDP